MKPDLKYGYDPRFFHVMGVDQGAYIAIWRLIPYSRVDLYPFGRWQLVFADFVPDREAFTDYVKGAEGRLIARPGLLEKLMDQWKIGVAVIDAEPSGNDALSFQKHYGQERKVWVNHSTKMTNIDDPRIGFNWMRKRRGRSCRKCLATPARLPPSSHSYCLATLLGSLNSGDFNAADATRRNGRERPLSSPGRKRDSLFGRRHNGDGNGILEAG